jgi:hypothetical protein
VQLRVTTPRMPWSNVTAAPQLGALLDYLEVGWTFLRRVLQCDAHVPNVMRYQTITARTLLSHRWHT